MIIRTLSIVPLEMVVQESGWCNFASAASGMFQTGAAEDLFFLPERNEIILSNAAPGVVCSDCRVLSEGDLNRASGGKDVIRMAYCVGFPYGTSEMRDRVRFALPEVSISQHALHFSWRDWPFVRCACLSPQVSPAYVSRQDDCLIGNVIGAAV